MDVDVSHNNDHDAPTTDPAGFDAIQDQQGKPQRDVDETWNKRQRELETAVESQAQLAEKYKEWSAAQELELLDRPLPLAGLEELSTFICEEIVRVYNSTDTSGRKRTWTPPLPPLHHPCWPFWAPTHPANKSSASLSAVQATDKSVSEMERCQKQQEITTCTTPTQSW